MKTVALEGGEDALRGLKSVRWNAADVKPVLAAIRWMLCESGALSVRSTIPSTARRITQAPVSRTS